MSLSRAELQDKALRLQAESEQALQQLEEAELKASSALKQAGTTEAQLSEAQVHWVEPLESLENHTKSKFEKFFSLHWKQICVNILP